jgi:hypothetical protein
MAANPEIVKRRFRIVSVMVPDGIRFAEARWAGRLCSGIGKIGPIGAVLDHAQKYLRLAFLSGDPQPSRVCVLGHAALPWP